MRRPPPPDLAAEVRELRSRVAFVVLAARRGMSAAELVAILTLPPAGRHRRLS